MTVERELELLRSRVEQLESRAAVTELAHRYCRHLDERDIDGFRLLWLPDATWKVSEDRIGEGIEGILELVRTMWRSMDTSRHWTTNLEVAVAGERATATAEVLAAVYRDSGWTLTIAGYDDEYVRANGCWYFDRRTISIRHRIRLQHASTADEA